MEAITASRDATPSPRRRDWRTIEGIVYVLITGCRWQDLPRGYGAPTTVWRRLKWWGEAGVTQTAPALSSIGAILSQAARLAKVEQVAWSQDNMVDYKHSHLVAFSEMLVEHATAR